jgi:resolvase-like protein
MQERPAGTRRGLKGGQTYSESWGLSGVAVHETRLHEAEKSGFDVLYVWKIDRFGRDAEELLRARRMLEQAGVRIVSVTEGDSESHFFYGIRVLIAEWTSLHPRGRNNDVVEIV